MSKTNRGGLTLKTGKIGRVNCLRQQIMMPGERINMSINGSVRLESLRERDAMRINAHIATFMTPLRWLWPEFTDYVKEGPSGSRVIPTTTETDGDWSKYGIGAYAPAGFPYTKPMFKHFKDAPLRIYNEWYKWPEHADATTWDIDGNIAVPLSAPWSRARYNIDPDVNETQFYTGGASYDVRDLADVQAKFRSAMKRDILSYNRWMELVQDTWKGDGSREVDKVPIMLDQANVGVNPREMPATDGASLGQWQSLYKFDVDHQINGIVAPEHCIITTMLVVRFPAVTETFHPLASQNVIPLDYYEFTGDPEYLSTAQPQLVFADEIFSTGALFQVGEMPAGWQWKAPHDVIGKRIYDKGSFPYMRQPTSQDECKDATRVYDAFRSATLGDYYCDIYFRESSIQPIGTAMDSYFSGMVDHTKNVSQTSDNFPKTGKML